jgi:hypothetical protein
LPFPWLSLVLVAHPVATRGRSAVSQREIDSLRAAIEDLQASFRPRHSKGEDYLQQLDAVIQSATADSIRRRPRLAVERGHVAFPAGIDSSVPSERNGASSHRSLIAISSPNLSRTCVSRKGAKLATNSKAPHVRVLRALA